MVITLIRHGMTRANEERLYCGATDIPLSPSGESALRELALLRPPPKVEIVADTGMLRTVGTADILYPGIPRISLPELREMDFGLFEGRKYDELRYDPQYIEWIEDQSGDYTCPRGESRNAFYRRAARGFADFCEKWWGKSAAIVCHGGTVCAIMGKFCDERRNFYEWQPDFGHGYKINAILTDGVKKCEIIEEV